VYLGKKDVAGESDAFNYEHGEVAQMLYDLNLFFIEKLPAEIPPFYNITYSMDIYVWILIFASLFIVAMTLTATTKVNLDTLTYF